MREDLLRLLSRSLLVAFISTIVVDASAFASNSGSTVAQKSKAARATKAARVRRDLHRNLDGKGNGFIVSWSFNNKVFTLTIDPSRYEQNMLNAATMTARSIFDSNEMPLPGTLVIRDTSGRNLGEGPFENVPKIWPD